MIDINTYSGHWVFRPLPGATLDDLHAKLSAEGISQAVVSPIEGIFYDEPQIANTRLYAEIMGFQSRRPVEPQKFFLCAVLNPLLRNCFKSLECCIICYNAKSIKLFPNYHHYEISDEKVLAFLDSVANFAVPVVIQLRIQDIRSQNCNWMVPDVAVNSVIDVIGRFPKTNFVIGGIKWFEAQSYSKEIASLNNAYIDISGIECFDGLRKVIDIYGFNRLLFGSHFPFFVIRSAILKLRESRLSVEEMRAITEENAKRIFSIFCS